MPPRFTYWTIILDGQPTAFRAAEREDLLPTLKQLQTKNPTAEMKWFARGRVWDSPEEASRARAEAEAAHRAAQQKERRGHEWRPGGEHRDPREKFKKETFQARKRRERKAANLARPAGPRPVGEGRGPGWSNRRPRGEGGVPKRRGFTRDRARPAEKAKPFGASRRGAPHERPWQPDGNGRPVGRGGPSRRPVTEPRNERPPAGPPPTPPEPPFEPGPPAPPHETKRPRLRKR
jgi:hypothetical protein